MTFQSNINNDDDDLYPNAFRHGGGTTCFVCYKKVENAVVYHDGIIDGPMMISSDSDTPRKNPPEIVNQNHQHYLAMLVMHPACAAILGQRLISDGYINRNKG